jgi:hypothetical protein
MEARGSQPSGREEGFRNCSHRLTPIHSQCFYTAGGLPESPHVSGPGAGSYAAVWKPASSSLFPCRTGHHVSPDLGWALGPPHVSKLEGQHLCLCLPVGQALEPSHISGHGTGSHAFVCLRTGQVDSTSPSSCGKGSQVATCLWTQTGLTLRPLSDKLWSYTLEWARHILC